MRRKELLVSENVYHIFSKSIAAFKIFNTHSDYIRMEDTIRYYQFEKRGVKFSKFIKSPFFQRDNLTSVVLANSCANLVVIIAYCLMPTHLHLILQQLVDGGISTFIGNVLNSYSRYFNIKHNRKGPLWESKFKNVLVNNSEQLLHLTRYLHLNPVTSGLVSKPEDWTFSSYREFLWEVEARKRICNFEEFLELSPFTYRQFVEDRVSYQRELAKIKHLVID